MKSLGDSINGEERSDSVSYVYKDVVFEKFDRHVTELNPKWGESFLKVL